MVSVRTRFAGALFDAVDHVGGIGRVHSAHLHIACGKATVAITHQYAGHLAKGFGDVLVRAGVQFFLADDGDGRRCLTAFLCETGGGDHQLIFIIWCGFFGENGRREAGKGERNRQRGTSLVNHNAFLRTGLNRA